MTNPSSIDARYNNAEYLQNNADWHASDSAWKARQINKILERNNIRPETICEVGCGAGEILVQLQQSTSASRLDGFELSKDAFEICSSKAKAGLNFYLDDIENTTSVYDILLCIDVFEHVQNYIEFVRNLRPKAEYKIFHIPLDISISSIIRGGMMRARHSIGHLHYFTPETAIATLEDAGLEIVDQFYTAPFAGPDCIPAKSVGQKALKIPRLLLYSISPNFLSKTIGGCSLLVLTR